MIGMTEVVFVMWVLGADAQSIIIEEHWRPTVGFKMLSQCEESAKVNLEAFRDTTCIAMTNEAWINAEPQRERPNTFNVGGFGLRK